MFLCRLCMHWVLWWRWSLHWEERISGAVCHPQKKLMIYRVVSYDIGERCSVQDEENGPQYWARRHTVHVIVMKTSYLLKWTDICLRDIIIITHSFYIALFSALEQTHCAHWQVILNERLQPFIARIINIHRSGVLIALCGCCMAGATWNAAVSAQVMCTAFNHAPGYCVTSFKAT